MSEFDFGFEEEHTDNNQEETEPKKMSTAKKIGIVLSIFVLIIASFIGGLFAGASGSDSDSISRVKMIESKTSILDDLESLKDAQIENLNNKLKLVDSNGKKSQSRESLSEEQINNLKALFKGQAENYQLIDQFLDTAMAIKKNAKEGELDVARKTIAELMTPAAQVSRSYDIVNGVSAAKVLGENGRKASASNIWMSWADSKDRVYMVITPFLTESEALTHQVSIIKVSEGKIDDFKFVGLIESPEADTLEKAFISIGKSTSDEEKEGQIQDEALKQDEAPKQENK